MKRIALYRIYIIQDTKEEISLCMIIEFDYSLNFLLHQCLPMQRFSFQLLWEANIAMGHDTMPNDFV